MKISEQLSKARELISNEKNWIKGAYATDNKGVGRDPLSPYATCFCALGAIRVATNSNKDWTTAHRYLENLVGSSLDVFNDKSSHEEVLSVFDLGIAQASKDEV